MAALVHGGRLLPDRAVDRLRDFAHLTMGVGSGHLGVNASGERHVLRKLAMVWAGREAVTVVDVGAHKGEYTDAVLDAFGAKARIHCFEPNPERFARLSERFAGGSTVTCHEIALSRASGLGSLHLDQAGSPRGSLEADTHRISGHPIQASMEVQLTTLDTAADKLGLTHVDLLKIDVEGHETAVLEGCAGLLRRQAVEVVQFEFGQANLASRTYLRDFFELLGPGFTFFRIGPRGLRQLEYDPKLEIFSWETNYLAVAAGTSIAAR
jgi:FkbM family methyltransferase